MASFVENNPQEQPDTDNSIEADKENSDNADGEELDLSDAKKVKKWCNVRACDSAPPCALLNEPRACQELVYTL